jgi:hypothetical protein
MTVPAIVRERLGEDDVTARVPLGGDDELLVTPDRTLIYRAEGLLSGESVEEYPLEAERVTVGEGRRKATITLDHGIDGESTFSVPGDRFEEAIEPILGGVFASAGITEPGETIADVYRLGELTLVITDARVIKHVGAALWDDEYEEYPFESVTAIDVEEGSVSSQIIVEVDRRPQRIKTPTDDARRIRGRIEEGVLDYHDVATYDEFLGSVQAELEAEEAEDDEVPSEDDADAEADEPEPAEPDDPEEPTEEEPPEPDEPEEDDDEGTTGMIFGEGVGTAPVEESHDGDELADELASLRAAVERQNDLLRRHQQAIERLTRELRDDD